MCSITGSFSTEKLRELVDLNLYRGNATHSISYVNPKNGHIDVNSALGPINIDAICVPEGWYGICHTQAPTTQAQGLESVHPAAYNNQYLWHNGIVKAYQVEQLQKQYGDDEWDTLLLLKKLVDTGTPSLVDGTFSCVWYTRECELVVFRNEISPLFIDEDLNISSTKFENSSSIPSEKLLELDLINKSVKEVGSFKTVETPYFFWD